ncbi:MAG: hypothetical protein QXD32_04170, partial [Nitrososphaerota archaeon]
MKGYHLGTRHNKEIENGKLFVLISPKTMAFMKHTGAVYQDIINSAMVMDLRRCIHWILRCVVFLGDFIGQAVRRAEDPTLVRGLGTYVDDVFLPRMLYAAFLRSPYPHARIRSIDVSEARRSQGVALVLTGSDIVKILPPLPLTVSHPQMRRAECYCLAVNKVFYVGEPVAIVIAEDRYVAQDALELIAVNYEELPPVVDMEKAIRDDAPIIHEGWP